MVVHTASFLAHSTGLIDIVKQLLHDRHQIFAIVVAHEAVAGVTVALGAAYAIFDYLMVKYSYLFGAVGVVIVVVSTCSGLLNERTLLVVKNDLLGVLTGKSSLPCRMLFGGKSLLSAFC